MSDSLASLRESVRRMEELTVATSLMEWDMRINAPREGERLLGEAFASLSSHRHQILTSAELADLIGELQSSEESLDPLERAMLRNVAWEHARYSKIPVKRYVEYTKLINESEQAWARAKADDSFLGFRGYLEKVVEFQREFADYAGTGRKNCYDVLLGWYEPGLTTESADRIFAKTRDGISKLLCRIQGQKRTIRNEFLNGSFSEELQKELFQCALRAVGFNLDAGRLDLYSIPFCVAVTLRDVRIATRANKASFISGLFSTLHEGGRGIYLQNIRGELAALGLGAAPSMGLQESQAVLFENFIGRSLEFWSFFYGEVTRRFPQFNRVHIRDFWRAINVVTPTLTRSGADEVTYSLHAIIRYELEKALISDELSVSDLPWAWRDKYRQYLGLEVRSDREGILQDVHWAVGLFGYLPALELGKIYAGQLWTSLVEQNPDIMSQVAQGSFWKINRWLREKVHQHGKASTSREIIQSATGESLQASHYLSYLNSKYQEVYEI